MNTMTLNNRSSIGGESELPTIVKNFPVTTYKRFSNIKYVELKDIVKQSTMKSEPYHLIKKSTLTSYQKRILQDYVVSNEYTAKKMLDIHQAMNSVRLALVEA